MESRVVQIQEEYLPGIVDLFWQIFQKRIDIQALEKQYFNHPLGIQQAGFIALNQQKKVIAFCGGMVCQLKYENNTTLGLQFGDTMTLPMYQGQGLFTKLSQELVKWAIEKKILVHFGFLNEHSYWAYTKKLNWTIIGRMQRWTISVRTIPFQKIAEMIPAIYPLWKWYANWIIYRNIHFEQMPNSLEQEGGIHLIHDNNFYTQKSKYFQSFFYLDPFYCWLKLHKGLWVGDIHLQNNPVKTIANLRLLARKCGIHALQLQFLEGSKNEKIMTSKFTAHQSWQIGGCSFDVNWPIEKIQLVLGDLDTF